MKTKTTEAQEATDYDRRTIRAATESMTVTPAGKGRFDVYNIEGHRYDVSLVSGECSCPDFERRGASLPNGCKHLQRVEIEAGIREIPAELAGRRTDAELAREGRARRNRNGAKPEPSEPEPVEVGAIETAARAIVTDGGVIVASSPQGLSGETCDHPDCQHGEGLDRPVLCWDHWEARQEARR